MKQLWKQLIATCLLLVSTITHAGWTVRYQHTDTLGSVIAQSNDQGTISQRFDYKPFGEGTPTQKSGLGYTGHLEDTDLGLTYMQQRYYDPVVGRFYSNDPMGMRDTHSFNRYTYANNNPYKFTDPTGMASKSENKGSGFCGVSGCDYSYSSGDKTGKREKKTLDSPVENAPISSLFGANRDCNPCSKAHAGTDYMVQIGTAVFVTANGVVARVYNSSTYGNVVIVDHGLSSTGSGNVYTLYAHASKLLVSEGQHLVVGQKILYSGNSGNSTGPHLHYEVIKTSSSPFEEGFFNNIRERYAPSELNKLLP